MLESFVSAGSLGATLSGMSLSALAEMDLDTAASAAQPKSLENTDAFATIDLQPKVSLNLKSPQDKTPTHYSSASSTGSVETTLERLQDENDALQVLVSQSHVRLAVAEDLVAKLTQQLKKMTREQEIPLAPPASRFNSLTTPLLLHKEDSPRDLEEYVISGGMALSNREEELDALSPVLGVSSAALQNAARLIMTSPKDQEKLPRRKYSSTTASVPEDGVADDSKESSKTATPPPRDSVSERTDRHPAPFKSDSNRGPSKWLTPSTSLNERDHDTPIKRHRSRTPEVQIANMP